MTYLVARNLEAPQYVFVLLFSPIEAPGYSNILKFPFQKENYAETYHYFDSHVKKSRYSEIN